MAIIEPPEIPEIPPEPPPNALPGLGSWLVPRYSCNLAITEEIKLTDLLYDVIFVSSRLYLTQSHKGKIRIRNKKPVDWALGTAAFSATDTVVNIDNVQPWVFSLLQHLMISPHTDLTEIRFVTAANYSTSQNSVTLTTSHSGVFTISGFAGCDGNSTPATATITVGTIVASTDYTITLDGFEIEFKPSAADTADSVASFIAGCIRGNPAVNRRFIAEVTANVVTITAHFGTLTLDTGLTNAHDAPVADPVTAPTLTAATGTLVAGWYRVAYSYRNIHGETRMSSFKSITLAANEKIQVSAITPPAGCTVVWYVSPEKTSTQIRRHSENDGSAFEITSLPLLSASRPPDINRTGSEILRIAAVFSDRADSRTNLTRSNVINASFEWLLGTREKSINRIDLKYRDANQDWRLTELRLRDDAKIAKLKQTNPREVNGQGIDNIFQAERIASGLLAEAVDADFFYRWSATREAGLLEEADVVAITDDSSGVVNMPVAIESIEIDLADASLPQWSFTARKYANTLWDDSQIERVIPMPIDP